MRPHDLERGLHIDISAPWRQSVLCCCTATASNSHLAAEGLLAEGIEGFEQGGGVQYGFQPTQPRPP